MKKFLLMMLAAVYLAACSNNSSNETEVVSDSTTAEAPPVTVQSRQHFPELYRYLSTQDPDFNPDEFEGGELVQRDSIAPSPIDTSALKPFIPYLIYNSDSSKAIDLVSYHYVLSPRKGLEAGEPDNEVAVLDLEKGTRKRLVFTGPSTAILDAAWLPDGSVMIAGAEDLGNGGIRPLFWHMSESSKSFFTYKQVVNADINDYTERTLRNRAAQAKTSPSF